MAPNGEDEQLKSDMATLVADGWTLQQDSCSSGQSHQFEIGEPLEGVVRGIRNIKVRRGGEMVKARLITLMGENGVETVWESAALSGLFDVATVGDAVRIEYLGEVEMPAPKSPMKDYRVWVRPHGEG